MIAQQLMQVAQSAPLSTAVAFAFVVAHQKKTGLMKNAWRPLASVALSTRHAISNPHPVTLPYTSLYLVFVRRDPISTFLRYV